MKRFSIWVALALSVIVLFVRANGPDDDYVRIYALIQEADQLNGSRQKELARDRYQEAETALKKFQAAFPNWNAKVVAFRIGYLRDKLAELGSAAKPKEGLATIPQVTRDQSLPPVDTRDNQVKSLTDRVRQLESERTVLEAKLKEALTAQPAAVDPRELAKAEEKIKTLEKEKDLLRVSLEQEQAKQNKPGDSSGADELKNALADAKQNLKRQTDIAVALAREKEILEARLQSARKDEETIRALRSENDNLKKQLASTKPTPPTVGSKTAEWELSAARSASATNAAMVQSLQASLKSLQDEKLLLERSKKDLETRLANLSSTTSRSTSNESGRVKQLESERDDLLKRLNETTRQLYDNKARSDKVQRNQYDNQMEILRARLEVFEARKLPYTPEELALFKQPGLASSKSDNKAGKKPLREMPKGAGPLITEAERAFATRRYDEAEQKYLQVLKLDDKNVFTLGNLAAAQLEQNRLEQAEANLRRALSVEPDDAHSLSLLGILKFRQQKYDDALDALSRAGQLDPQNAETQNYLGITLSQKGQRGPAEAALRKAIQINPGSGGAHHNLAVIYATQQPPFTELARYHYQKALAVGHPQNAELEKLIEGGQLSSGGK